MKATESLSDWFEELEAENRRIRKPPNILIGYVVEVGGTVAMAPGAVVMPFGLVPKADPRVLGARGQQATRRCSTTTVFSSAVPIG